VPVLKLLVQQSNCFVIVDRGRALGTAMGERSLNASGELRKTSKMHKGQMVAADYTISPTVTFSNRDAGGGAAGLLAFVPVVGGVLAGAAGTMKPQEASTMLTLVDNRSSVQLAAAEGSAPKVDFGMLSGVFAGGFGGAGAAGGGAYARTAQGRSLSQPSPTRSTISLAQFASTGRRTSRAASATAALWSSTDRARGGRQQGPPLRQGFIQAAVITVSSNHQGNQHAPLSGHHHAVATVLYDRPPHRRVGRLLLRRRITWQTFKYSLRERPIAVAGRAGCYVVDPDFD